MKKTKLFQKGLLAVFMAVMCGLLLSNCSKDYLIAESPASDGDALAVTRGAEFHWRCSNLKCGFLNAAWRDACTMPNCKGQRNPSHSRLILNFMTIVERYVPVGGDGGGSGRPIDDTTIAGRIELPGGLFPAYAPAAWYEASKALKFYNDLKATSSYGLNATYRADVDYAWYRTVRILYPGVTDVTKAQMQYDRWIISDGRNTTTGIVDGTKAALNAYKATR